MVFRNKYTAHRSIDVPWTEDTPDSQISHARSLSKLFGKLFTPRAGAPVNDWSAEPLKTREEAEKQIWSSNHLTFQIFDMKTKQATNFCLEVDHLDVMKEATVIFEALIFHC
jgi:hypothetical protein